MLDSVNNLENVGWIAAVITFLTGIFSKAHIWTFLNNLTGKGCRDKIKVIEIREAQRAVIYSRYFSSLNTLKILLKNLVSDDDPSYSLVREFIENLPSDEELNSLTNVTTGISEDKKSDTSY